MLLGQNQPKPLNRYSIWQYVFIALVILLAILYALPNLFGEDYSVQITGQNDQNMTSNTIVRVQKLLDRNDIDYKSIAPQGDSLLVRLSSNAEQLKVQRLLLEDERLARQFVVALNLAPATPDWLQSFNARPMYLGLDLRGGVYFLLEVDIESAIQSSLRRQATDVKRLLRDEDIRYESVTAAVNSIVVTLRRESDIDRAVNLFEQDFFNNGIRIDDISQTISIVFTEQQIKDLQDFAIKQNLITLRNRVNELGVAEPILQRQGANRIVVQLPGVQDTARAKEILGATATLEYRLVQQSASINLDQVVQRGYGPAGTRLYFTRNRQPVLLSNEVIVTGDSVINAQSGVDQNSGSPMVSVTLDGAGGKRMLDVTRRNVGQPMGVVFIQTRNEKRKIAGEVRNKRIKTETVINVATIREAFGNRFQTTGLDSPKEASDLALLLRAGALAAPMDIVEERTVGPSLGQDNIQQGLLSIIVGFIMVLLYMLVRYKVFGLFANVALALNLMMIVALLSLMQATLTLPGIAGILLTVGMAVDANVLIFERIREELRLGSTVPQAIHAGYSRAVITIADANITTLIAAIILFSFGTGPIKGFAITLSFGIITSMFTAIVVTRSIVNFLYGNARERQNLPI